MTDNEKLIDDATTAFTDREITPPSRDDLRIALDAFEASLTRCGCEPCTTARRARVALTDHDRTALARALHEIVYSPGANYDRAVPGIQEYMLACAEKVAAALPWLVPHTPTDDEREALAQVVCLALGHQDGGRECEVDYVVADAVAAAGFRRSEVPEPSAEEWAARVQAAREKAIAKGYTPEHDAKHGVRHLLRWAIDYARRGKAEDSSGLVAAAIDLADVAYAELERLRHVADTMKAVSEALRSRYASDSQAAYFMRQIDAALEALPDPQGEPSDAQVEAAARSWVMNGGVATWDNAAPHVRDNAIRRMREALRAAGGVR